MRVGTKQEFSAIRSYPHVERRFISGSRVQDLTLYYCGKIVAHKTEFYKWNKPVSEDILIDEKMLETIHA